MYDDRIPFPWCLLRLSIAAPAPSPKSTHVARSFQSTIALIFSEPTTSAVSAVPDMISPSAVLIAYSQPAHAAPPSDAAARVGPNSAWMLAAGDGSGPA